MPNLHKKIAVLAGDGIGPEITTQALRVLDVISEKFHHTFEIQEADVGGIAFLKNGVHFPERTREVCQKADAILLGAVGGPLHQSHLPQWHQCEKNSILALRETFQFSVNIRPTKLIPALSTLSPLKKRICEQGIDFVIIRELVGDIYFGEHKQWNENEIRHASDVAEYDEAQIAAVAHFGFQLAQKRCQKLTSVDKANVLETSRLWRTIVTEISAQYPDVTYESMLVDNCAMQLVLNPSQFDVLLTSNLFGDILSDQAAAFSGSLGLSPSASLNAAGFGLYEPSGGSAPDIAGKNIANPISQILSVAMMLRHSFQLSAEASCIEHAVQKTLAAGHRTRDLTISENNYLNTQAITDIIIHHITAEDTP